MISRWKDNVFKNLNKKKGNLWKPQIYKPRKLIIFKIRYNYLMVRTLKVQRKQIY